MAEKVLYRCIICGTEAADKPPRRCPKCGAPSGRWKMVVDRDPEPPPAKPADEPAPAPEKKQASAI